MEERRFSVAEQTMDQIRDSLSKPPRFVATVPPGQAQAFIDGAYYEQHRILDILHNAGVSLPDVILDRIMGE